MSEKELQEIFELLEKSGMNPLLCDTPVPVYENIVPAGIPIDPGDAVMGDYILFPRDLAKWDPIFLITVQGDSMRGVGIMTGDQLQVQMDATIHDGDIVLASIDGECTVKTYYTDEFGDPWLVPHNEKCDAIPLTGRTDVRFYGKVVGCLKDAPRGSSRDCMDAIRRTRNGSKQPKEITPERIENAVKTVAIHVEYARQWYAVYRALLDHKAVSEGDFEGFEELVRKTVPDHPRLPKATELGRIAVQSFRKPVSRWDRDNAPVSGGRFLAYLRIAQMTADILTR